MQPLASVNKTPNGDCHLDGLFFLRFFANTCVPLADALQIRVFIALINIPWRLSEISLSGIRADARFYLRQPAAPLLRAASVARRESSLNTRSD